MKDVSDMLLMLKSNLRHIEITVQSWRTLPVFERASKPMLIHDFLALQKKVCIVSVGRVRLCVCMCVLMWTRPSSVCVSVYGCVRVRACVCVCVCVLPVCMLFVLEFGHHTSFQTHFSHYTPHFDFPSFQVQNTRVSAVKEAGQEIHRLLKDTNKKLKISQGLPDWRSYVEFVNNVVVDGLIEAVAASIRALAAQVSIEEQMKTILSCGIMWNHVYYHPRPAIPSYHTTYFDLDPHTRSSLTAECAPSG